MANPTMTPEAALSEAQTRLAEALQALAQHDQRLREQNARVMDVTRGILAPDPGPYLDQYGKMAYDPLPGATLSDELLPSSQYALATLEQARPALVQAVEQARATVAEAQTMVLHTLDTAPLDVLIAGLQVAQTITGSTGQKKITEGSKTAAALLNHLESLRRRVQED